MPSPHAAEPEPPDRVLADRPERGDVPKLELDELLLQLIDRAQDVVATQSRLRGLLRANQAIVGDLSLPVLLRRIVEAACELADARYGALGVTDESGVMEQFVHVGVDEETAAAMEHLPEGKGLLGALIADPHPIRLHRMDGDPRSIGFPEGHPAMTSFLGVPIRVRNEIFGNLYLTESAGGEFSAEDEELVLALAATAGVAIENARLYEDARRRQDWLRASTEVTQRLLSADGEDPLHLIARQAQRLAAADLAMIVLPTPDGSQVVIKVATGQGAEELLGRAMALSNSLVERVLRSARPVQVTDLLAQQGYSVHLTKTTMIGPAMVLPLGGLQSVLGAVILGRERGRHPFSKADLDMATTFAGQATVALELATARSDQQLIARLEDRNRIARDLHDHVIQRLFAIGLTVQSVADGVRPEEAQSRLTRVVADLDETIRQTRTSIFELQGPLAPGTDSVRSRMLDVAKDVSSLLGFDARVRFIGPIDAIVPEDVADDLLAVVREALTNTARHASARHADVELRSTPGWLSLKVTDDGVGIGAGDRRSGLANLLKRAERHHGSLDIGGAGMAGPGRDGTCLQWAIPLP